MSPPAFSSARGSWRCPVAAKRRAVGLGAALERIAAKVDTRGELARARAVAVWPAAVGQEVAKRTHCTALRKGELLVHVDSPAWATQLQAMAPQIAEAVNHQAGKRLVSSVRFTVSRTVREERERDAVAAGLEAVYRPERIAPVPLTPGERAQVEATAAAIDDDELRAAAIRAMAADLEWKKGVRAAAREAPPDTP
ncbi:MAG: hypothetical protein C0418_00120 [Coriobacteriaceae bacterium]|nr:hypothetical protein [Coriobacteriaceae bacterium]